MLIFYSFYFGVAVMAVNSYLLKLLVLPKFATFLFVISYFFGQLSADTIRLQALSTISFAALHMPPGIGR